MRYNHQATLDAIRQSITMLWRSAMHPASCSRITIHISACCALLIAAVVRGCEKGTEEVSERLWWLQPVS